MKLENNSELLKTRLAEKIVRHIKKKEKSISSFSLDKIYYFSAGRALEKFE